jgi:hypothetical protein
MAKKDKTKKTKVKEVKSQKVKPPLYDWMDELLKKEGREDEIK